MKKPMLALHAAMLLTVAPAALFAETVRGSDTPNAEPVVPVLSGFAISLNGDRVVGDPQVEDKARRADLALAAAGIQVRFDGLDLDPRLALFVDGAEKSYAPGDQLRVVSRLNYSDFVDRGEVLVTDLDTIGGAKVVARYPIEPGGSASFALPDTGRLVLTHRVYDAQGRFDETRPIDLNAVPETALARDADIGLDMSARRRVPLVGGAVTVSGRDLPPKVKIDVMGEEVVADPQGAFVVQKILPPGPHSARIWITGAGAPIDVIREFEIPEAEWFGVGSADVTIGARESDLGGSESFQRGRISGFVDGKRADGARITASIDTGEEDLSDLFSRLDERDPRNTALRVDPDDLYPTYGDDSQLEERAPTSGKLFFRFEKNGNFLQWGDDQADVSGGHYLRNERKLYGLTAGGYTQEQTSRGEARGQVTVYGAQPDQLAQRDVFQATGGSVYFLSRSDVTIGTETLSVQVRDRVSGRVIETVPLVAGRDYDFNFIQGVVTLKAPLSGVYASTGVVQTTPSGDTDIALVAQYEYTPGADLDDFAYGTRLQYWATDRLRFGVTGMVEQTDLGEQSMASADLRFQLGDRSFASLEYAATDGPGIGASLSSDGGFVFDTDAGAMGSGAALRGEIQLNFDDFGLNQPGALSAYLEEREEGFSSLDYRVTGATGNETLWGLAGDLTLRPGLELSFVFDDYSNAMGAFERSGEVAITYAVTDRLTFALGVENTEKNRGSEVGDRSDLGLRIGYEFSEDAELYAFAQSTVSRQGLPANDRAGVGGAWRFDSGWRLSGEISDGAQGLGGRVLAEVDRGEGRTGYAGYELTPGRDFAGVTLSGSDAGRYILGGRAQVTDKTQYFGENSYDLYGDHRSLSSAYGVTYQATDVLSYTGAIEAGTVRDTINGDFDRRALSFGVRSESTLTKAGARLEYRTDVGALGGTTRDAKTLLVAGDLSHKFDDSQRLILTFQATQTDGDGVTPGGEYVDISAGYALRPVTSDRFNLLARYRYLYDTFGQRIDGADVLGPIQRSHVVSVDGIYALNDRWELGGKLGLRFGESAADPSTPWQDNNAWLGVVNARYHMDHQWDALLELRNLTSGSGAAQEFGVLGAVYRQVGKHVKAGVGMNWGRFSDDLTDLTFDDRGAFVNVVASF